MGRKKANSQPDLPPIVWPLKDILLPDEWNRTRVDKEKLKGLMSSIKAQGQITPLLVCKTENPDKVMLVDGRRRYTALSELGVESACVHFTKEITKPVDAEIIALIANLAKEEMSDYDQARSFKKLADAGFSCDQIADCAGYTAGYVSQRSGIFRHDPRLVLAFQKGAIPLAMFRALAPLDTAENSTDIKFYNKMVDTILRGNITAQAISEKVNHFKDLQKSAEPKTDTDKKSKRPGPKINVVDYTAPEIRKSVKMIPKDKVLEYLEHYSKVLVDTRSKAKRDAIVNRMIGIELCAGLAEESIL